MLHKQSAPPPPPADDPVGPVLRSKQNYPTNSVLLQIALVNISTGSQQQRTRAVLDSGAAMSLTTSRLANSLASRKLSSISIMGVSVTSPVRSNSIVDLTLTAPFNPSAKPIHIQAHVVEKICSDHRDQHLDVVKELAFLRGKMLADPYFDHAGRFDLLLGIAHTTLCAMEGVGPVVSSNHKLQAIKTIFDWVVGGDSGEVMESSLRLRAEYDTSTTNCLLQRLWEQEEMPQEEEPCLAKEEQRAVDLFPSTTTRLKDKRYQVRLPSQDPPLELDESRSIAERRFLQNERSLRRKGTLEAYNEQLKDYAKQGHAEIVPAFKPTSECYYLPMHGVVKASSSTMKLRVVCDASAKSSNGRSLNDILLPGPSLYPRLTTVLQQFRLYDIAFSADISRMFREVALHSEDRDLHQYMVRNSQNELEDWRMTRVTFGVTSSPFLATAVLRQVAKDHSEDHFTATLVPTKFYVDDFLHRTNSIEEAQAVRKDINALLAKAQMKLRK